MLLILLISLLSSQTVTGDDCWSHPTEFPNCPTELECLECVSRSSCSFLIQEDGETKCYSRYSKLVDVFETEITRPEECSLGSGRKPVRFCPVFIVDGKDPEMLERLNKESILVTSESDNKISTNTTTLIPTTTTTSGIRISNTSFPTTASTTTPFPTTASTTNSYPKTITTTSYLQPANTATSNPQPSTSTTGSPVLEPSKKKLIDQKSSHKHQLPSKLLIGALVSSVSSIIILFGVIIYYVTYRHRNVAVLQEDEPQDENDNPVEFQLFQMNYGIAEDIGMVVVENPIEYQPFQEDEWSEIEL